MKKINIYHCLFIIISLTFSPLMSNAQSNRFKGGSWKKENIGNCMYKITYDYKYYKDTIQQQPFHDVKCLEIGKERTAFFSLLEAKLDSTAIARNKAHNSRAYNPSKEAKFKSRQSPVPEDIYFNYPESGTLFLSGMICYREYYYKEPIPVFKWKILSQSDSILGYKCFTATTFFRGRYYKAWFTQDIPLHYGPYKFNGLPGLILKIEDKDKLFTWTAIAIETTNNKTSMFLKQAKPQILTNKKKYDKVNRMKWKDPVQLYMLQGVKKVAYIDKNGKVQVRKPGSVSLPPIPAIELE
ncbi:MAG: GLPGLI family protein [Bacteroidales bacterium]|jgi:GLPGLI family protein|nr:GLPGLI family protein [Bacteroidales bacterium]